MRWAIAILLVSAAFSGQSVFALDPPPVQLGEVYHFGDEVDLSAYLVSEKFDGVRGWWDGHQFITRGGGIIHAPAWFTAVLPDTVIDGELWAGRGAFEADCGILRKQQPSDEEWRRVRYQVFDLPREPGVFGQRVQAIARLVAQIDKPWVQAVVQTPVADVDELHRRFDAVIAGGGEGLMLHRRDSLYVAGRSRDMLKLKPYDDAEAVVVGYLPGKGRYEGLLGALQVQRKDGREFRIGGGLKLAQRRDPPPLGSTITYTYTSLTAQGLPRFPRLLRIRNEP